MRIGFFDSGVGGLTVLKESLKSIKGEYIYFADNQHAPYGTKEKNTVKKYVFECMEKIVNSGCSIIVIACNTATSIAIKELREKYPHVIFIGTEPAVKVAVDDIHTRVLVCATSLTIKGEKLSHLINKLDAVNDVDFIAADNLVVFAENISVDKKEVKQYLKQILANINKKQYSHVVLGCTHFSLFKKEFQKIFGERTKIIDGNVGIVKNLKRHLELDDVDSGNNASTVELILSKENPSFVKNAKKILDMKELNYYHFS